MQRIVVILSMLMLLTAAAPCVYAQCVCRCVDGKVQPICTSSIDVRPICSPTICPIVPPSVQPIPKPQIPPIGTNHCAQKQVLNPQNQQYEWMTLCSNENGQDNSSETTTTTATGTPSSATQQPADDIQAERQEEFESGYVVGQAIGNSIAVAIQKHRIKSFCKKNGDTGYWRFDDGSIVTCASINAGHPVREWPAQVRRPDPALQSDGLEAYDLMESFRKNMPDVVAANGGMFGPSFVEDLKKNWANMRDIYCKASPGAAYIDLQNQQQTCPK